MDALDLTIRKPVEETRVQQPHLITTEQFTTSPIPAPIFIKTETPIPNNCYTPELPHDYLETSNSPTNSETVWRQRSPDTTSAFYPLSGPPTVEYLKKPVTPTAARPFKAYTSSKSVTNFTQNYLYQTPEWFEYRHKMLDQIKSSSSQDGFLNTKMRRENCRKGGVEKNNNYDSDKDAAYWERRRKNNEAAKKSRDARRQKEDEIAIRAGFLEREYLRLQYENRQLMERLARYEPNTTSVMFAGHVM